MYLAEPDCQIIQEKHNYVSKNDAIRRWWGIIADSIAKKEVNNDKTGQQRCRLLLLVGSWYSIQSLLHHQRLELAVLLDWNHPCYHRKRWSFLGSTCSCPNWKMFPYHQSFNLHVWQPSHSAYDWWWWAMWWAHSKSNPDWRNRY